MWSSCLQSWINNLCFKANFNSFGHCTNELFFPSRCHQGVVAVVFLHVWTFCPLQHHLRVCSRSYRCPRLDPSAIFWIPWRCSIHYHFPLNHPHSSACFLCLEAFLARGELALPVCRAARNYSGLVRNWSPCIDTPASLSLGAANSQKTWMPITCSCTHPYWLPSSLLSLPTHSTSWGHSYPQESTTCTHILSSGSALEQPKLRQVMSRKSQKLSLKLRAPKAIK